jgi:hypothetical protein
MKKIYYIVLFLSFSVYQIAQGQDHKTITLDKGVKLFQSVAVNDNLITVTGKEYIFNANLKWKLSCYNPDLSLRYEFPINKSKFNLQNVGSLVVSPSANNVYYMNPGGTIMHLDSAGSVSEYKLKWKQIKWTHLNVIFADDEYLYYVNKEKDKTKKRQKKSFPKLQYIRVAHDKTVSRVQLELPDPDPDATEWSYLGHTTEVAYFVSRTNDDENKITYRIAVIDGNGALQDDFKMEMGIKDAILPSWNYSSAGGTLVVDDHQINITTTTHYSRYGSTTTVTYKALPEAFGDISFDPQTGGFYMYGLSGARASKKKSLFGPKKSDVASSFYVLKFDQDGKKMWNYEGKLSGADEDFKNKYSFVYRKMKLSPGFGGAIRFQAFAMNKVTTFELNPETGKLNLYYPNEFENNVSQVDLNTCHKPGDKSEVGKFLSKKDKGDCSTLTYRLNNTDVIIKNYYDDWKLEMYRFSDE